MKKKVIVVLIVFLLLLAEGCKNNENSSSSAIKNLYNVTLLSPTNGKLDQPVKVTFSWQVDIPLDATSSFTLLIGRSASKFPYVFKGIKAEVYTTVLTYSTNYFWKVQLVQRGKVVGESKVYSFTTGSSPAPVSLVSPVNGNVVDSFTILLKWKKVTNPDAKSIFYKVFFSSDPDNLEYIGKTTGSVFRVAPLSKATTYYWRVIAVNNNGSSMSPVWSFSTPSVPAPAQLLTPLKKGRIDVVTFKWKSGCSGRCTYNLYLGYYPDTITIVASGLTDTEKSLSLVSGYRYYWKVVSVDPSGLSSSSKVVSFVVDQLPTEPHLISPLDESTGITIPVFKWSCSDPDGDQLLYTIYVGESIDTMQVVASGVTSETYKLTNYDLQPANQYYWMVVADDQWGGETKSEIRHFYTNLPPNQFKLKYPVNISNVSVVPLFRWFRSRDPEGGRISYKVFLGKCGSVKEVTETTGLSFYAGELSPNTTYCWRVTAVDNIGLEQDSYSSTFTTGSGKVPLRRISMGKWDTYYIDKNGSLYSAGKNNEGEIGNGKFGDPVLSLYRLAEPDNWKVVGGGSLHVCAVDSAGELYCWGWNEYGQLGVVDNSNRAFPSQVHNPEGKAWVYVDGGDQFTCGVDEAGAIYCWGSNNKYQIGQSDASAFYGIPHRIYSTRKFTMVATGYLFACGLDVDHRIWCWGDNAHGQVPYPTPTSMPQEVTNADGTKWIMLSAGYDHVCAIDGNQQLWCWGSNKLWQIGNGGNEDKVLGYSPVKITMPTKDTRWRYVGAGAFSTCAVTVKGVLWCWGEGKWGKLGNGDVVNSPVPVRVINPSGKKWVEVASGLDHTCGINEDDELWCWGLNYGQITGDHYDSGMLAIGMKEGTRLVPENLSKYVPYLKPAELISGFDYTGAIDKNGDLYLWGYDKSAGYEDIDMFINYHLAFMGTPERQNLPMKFRTFSGSTSVMCGIADNYGVYCWGYNPYYLVLGSSLLGSETPVKINIPGRFINIFSGNYGYCAINDNGDLWCWGRAGVGAKAAFISSPPIKEARPGGKWITGGIGADHACAIDDNGKLYCWGSDDFCGNLGMGTNSGLLSSPEIVDADHRWKKVDASDSLTCAIDSNNDLYCWGCNSYGMLGLGISDYSTVVSYPTQITFPATKWREIKTGWGYACGIDLNGILYCWGKNDFGTIGNGTTQDAPYPVAVMGGKVKFIDVSVGERNTCAIDTNYNLWCWGYNDLYYSVQISPIGDGSLFTAVPLRAR